VRPWSSTQQWRRRRVWRAESQIPKDGFWSQYSSIYILTWNDLHRHKCGKLRSFKYINYSNYLVLVLRVLINRYLSLKHGPDLIRSEDWKLRLRIWFLECILYTSYILDSTQSGLKVHPEIIYYY
jgi:hypothetical protein